MYVLQTNKPIIQNDDASHNDDFVLFDQGSTKMPIKQMAPILLYAQMHNIVEMTNQGRKDVIFWFKSDNQRFMSRNIIIFVNQIDNNT